MMSSMNDNIPNVKIAMARKLEVVVKDPLKGLLSLNESQQQCSLYQVADTTWEYLRKKGLLKHVCNLVLNLEKDPIAQALGPKLPVTRLLFAISKHVEVVQFGTGVLSSANGVRDQNYRMEMIKRILNWVVSYSVQESLFAAVCGPLSRSASLTSGGASTNNNQSNGSVSSLPNRTLSTNRGVPCLGRSNSVETAVSSSSSSSQESTQTGEETTPIRFELTSSYNFAEKVNYEDSDIESVWSVQGEETAAAKDTTDIDPDEYDSDRSTIPLPDNTYAVEYEVEESATGEELGSDSDEPSQDLLTAVLKPVGSSGSLGIDSDDFADESDSPVELEKSSSSESEDSEVGSYDKWTCRSCHFKNTPRIRHCRKCWKVREPWLPPPREKRRVNWKRKPRKKVSKFEHRRGARRSGVQIVSMASNQEEGRTSNVIVPIEETSTSQATTLLGSSEEGSYVSEAPSKGGFNDSGEGSSSEGILQDPADNVEACSKGSGAPQQAEGSNSTPAPALPSTSGAIRGTKRFHSGEVKGGDRVGTCVVCCVKESNATLIHGRYGHQCVCYSCGSKLLNSGRFRCPVCFRQVSQVIRNYLV